MTGYVVAFFVCLALSAFFSASEMSLSAASHLRLESAAEEGSRTAKTALALLDRFDRALGAILIGNNLVNVASSSISSVIAITLAVRLDVQESLCTTAATVIVTVLVIIFGETIPKILAKKNANRLALTVATPVRILTMVFSPLVRCAVALTDIITKPMKDETEDGEEAAVEELQSIIETAQDEDVLDDDRGELLQNALEFGDVSASQAMTARVDMMALDIDDSLEDMLSQIGDMPYSRLPVYEESVDHIIGVLHLNTLYRALLDSESVNVRSLLTEPVFVYKTVKLPALLEQLRAKQTHMAVVTDEYGGTAGVITMEDILEYIVGDIWDETDEVEEEVVQTAADSWELDGDLPVDDFLELVGLDESEFDFESETVGGWVMELAQGYAEPGYQTSYKDVTITVLSADGKRIEKVRVARLPKKDEP